MSEQEAYELYKKRDIVEKLFDTYKSTLYADMLYFHIDESLFGHVFTAFLSLYAYCKIESVLKNAKLNKALISLEPLFRFSKTYHYLLIFQACFKRRKPFEQYSLKFP